MSNTNPEQARPPRRTPTDQPIIPGYLPICSRCVFKDHYETLKNATELLSTAQQQSQLIENLKAQLQASTNELESLKNPVAEPEEETTEESEEEEVLESAK